MVTRLCGYEFSPDIIGRNASCRACQACYYKYAFFFTRGRSYNSAERYKLLGLSSGDMLRSLSYVLCGSLWVCFLVNGYKECFGSVLLLLDNNGNCFISSSSYDRF